MDPIHLLERAESLLENDRPAAALPLLSRALRGGDRFFQADVRLRQAQALQALSRFEDALSGYWAAHKLYRLSGAVGEGLRALLGASACLRVLSRYRQADRMWRSVSRQLPALGSPFDPTPEEIHLEIALVRRGLGDMSGAIVSLRRLIPGLQDSAALQHAWWALAGAERFSGRYGRALKAFSRAAALARRNGDPSAEAYAWCGEAGALRILGNGSRSHDLYRRAHAFFRRSGDRFGEAYGLCGMGNALRTYGDPVRALPLYRASAVLYARVGDTGSRAFALWGMGGALRRLGRRKESTARYRESLSVFKKVGDVRGVLMALLGWGRVLGEEGATERAEALFHRAKVLARREKHPYEEGLSRLESARAAGKPLPEKIFTRFEIPATVIRRWKDLP